MKRTGRNKKRTEKENPVPEITLGELIEEKSQVPDKNIKAEVGESSVELVLSILKDEVNGKAEIYNSRNESALDLKSHIFQLPGIRIQNLDFWLLISGFNVYR